MADNCFSAFQNACSGNACLGRIFSADPTPSGRLTATPLEGSSDGLRLVFIYNTV